MIIRPARPLRTVIHLATEFRSITMLKPTAGEGYTFDLSTNGCRIESDSTVEVGSYLAIRVRLTDRPWFVSFNSSGQCAMGPCPGVWY
jgi:hypothetical protein